MITITIVIANIIQSLSSGKVIDVIANCRIDIESSRALVLSAAHLLDISNGKKARKALAVAKVAVPRSVLKVLDAAIQVLYIGVKRNDISCHSRFVGPGPRRCWCLRGLPTCSNVLWH